MNLVVSRMVRFPYLWRTVTDSDSSNWPFGVRIRLSKDLCKLFAGPRVYRFAFRENDEFKMAQAYVGEAENFRERYYGYRSVTSASTPASWTRHTLEEAFRSLRRNPNVRVRSAILNWMAGGHRVELQFLEFESFRLNRVLVTQDRLSNPFVRRLVENVAVLETEKDGYRIMNSGRDIQSKAWTKWFVGLQARSTKRQQSR